MSRSAGHLVRRSTLAILAAATAAYLFRGLPGVPPGDGYSPFWEAGIYNLVITGSALVVLWRAARDRDARAAWGLIGAGLSSYAAGTLLFSFVYQPMPEMPFPSVSDALWLAYYPFAFVGLALLAHARLAGSEIRLGRDGIIAGLATSAVGAAFLVDLSGGGGESSAAVLTNIAYPIADITLLALLVSAIAVLGRSAGRNWMLLASGTAAFAIADTWFLLAVSRDTYVPGSLVDALWAVGAAAVAGAAMMGEAAVTTPPARTGGTTLVPATFGAVAAGVLALGDLVPIQPAGTVLACICLAAAFLRAASAARDGALLKESRILASTDELTQLGNRRSFFSALGKALDRPEVSGSLLMLDLDRFKEVNDALGHATGDEILRRVASRVRSCLPPEADLFRLGGDEFGMLAPHLDEAAASVLARRVLTALDEPFPVAGMALQVGASVGISRLQFGENPSRVVAKADVAMYAAKDSRRSFHCYDDSTDGDAWNRLALVQALREGIAQRQLVLAFQPIVGAADGRVSALEALVRWRHPERGLLPPDAFLPLAEHAGLMQQVTARVLELAMDQAASLRRDGLTVPVAVNLSASDLLDLGLVRRVASLLEERALPGGVLHLEITETLLVNDEAMRKTLAALRNLGVGLSVDDYGTGYSSLAYLQDLPVTELKIDRAITDRVPADPRSRAIMASTIALAHDLGLGVIAEGVETAEQLLWLVTTGCDRVQGWHIGRPLFPQDLVPFLRGRVAEAA